MAALAKMPREIELLEKACAFLAECKDLDEIKNLRDKAEALRAYASQQKDGLAAQNAAGIIKVRAERRIGEISSKLDRSHPGKSRRDLIEKPATKSAVLMGAGISATVANNCEAIAEIPEEEFEEEIKATSEAGKEVTSSAMVKKGRTRKRKSQQRARIEAPATANGKHTERTWEILAGDCIEAMRGIEPGSVRLVFADPPYNIGIRYGDHYDDSRPWDEYEEWSKEWITVASDCLSWDGSLWLLIGWEWAHDLAVMGRDLGLTLRQTIVWYESFGVNTTKMFNRCSRALLWFTKHPATFVFNGHDGRIRRESDRQAKYNDRRADADGKLWDDVWGINPAIPRVTGTCRERLPDFPTQLPVALLRPVVACASDRGDVVLDPFCGSGTTGAACLELRRRFIGCELSDEFASVASKRLVDIERSLPDEA